MASSSPACAGCLMLLPLTKCLPEIGSGVPRPGSASSCAGIVDFLANRAMAGSLEFVGWSGSVGAGTALLNSPRGHAYTHDRLNRGFIALESASTPRLRATFAIYVALVAATAIVGPRAVAPAWYYLAGIAG